MARNDESNAIHNIWVELERFTDQPVGLDGAGLPCAQCPPRGSVESAGKRISARLQRISNMPPPRDSRRFCAPRERPLAQNR